MKNKNKNSKFKSKKVKHSFTGQKLTKYAGLSPIMKYLNKMKLGKSLNALFPTIMYNSTKFTNVQILMSIILASFSGVNRIVRIANFSRDSLVISLLGLSKGINKDAISTGLKSLGQGGAIRLQEYLFGWMTRWIRKSSLEEITIDADSTVQTVYGNQQGAAKGFNSNKKGAKSYHPLLAFASETKLVLNSWFRTGSAYTSNGICEFVKQTAMILPSTIKGVFFRADSGFFNGTLFDLLESKEWTYLVKVKLKNLKDLLKAQEWQDMKDNPNVAICEFEYKSKGWQKVRKLRAIRTVKRWVETDCLGELLVFPEYEYACYCSNLELDALGLHEKYKERSTSETWIEQVKSQLFAGKTITDNFHANDIIWQLNVLAYNLSVIMRYPHKRYWKQEHKTFRDWFINLPAKLVDSGRQITMKIYENYYYKDNWINLEGILIA